MLKLIMITLLTCQQTLANRGTCPPGWENLNDKCYLIQGEDKTTWLQARNLCQQQGAKLALPQSEEDSKALFKLYRTKTGKDLDQECFWIDMMAFDNVDGRDFTASNGDPLSYVNWGLRGNQPNQAHTCGCIGWVGFFYGQTNQWLDDECYVNYGYVCEALDVDDCFEENTLFLEDSIDDKSLQECQDECNRDEECKFFTWNKDTKGCGIRTYFPSTYVKVNGQQTAAKNGNPNGFFNVLDDSVFVGRALFSPNRVSCLEACKSDPQCFSCTYNEEFSDNSRVCTLNYGPTVRKLTLPYNAKFASASRFCSMQ